MSNETLLAWDTPSALVDLQREKGELQLVPRSWLILQVSWVLHLVALFVIYLLDQEIFPSYCLILLVSSLLMPCFFYFSMKSIYFKSECRYEIRQDGIFSKSSELKTLRRWNSIRSYEIKPNAQIPMLKDLIVLCGLSWSPSRDVFSFDPAEISEAQIKALIDERLNT